jgi:hypothetical protein
MTDERKDENLGSFYMGRMRPPPEPKRVLPKGALTTIAVLAFAGIVWYAYPQGQEKYTDVNVPVVTADTTPYKSKPADPGGMDVPHRDSTVFETVDGKKTPKADKVQPPQEQPLDKSKLALDSKKPQLNLEPQMKPEAANPAAKVDSVRVVPAKPEAPKAEARTEPAKAPVLKAAPAPAAPGKVYIQLGSYRDVAGAKTDWAKLQKKYPQYMKGLTMKTERVDLGPKGVFHRLQAGTLSESRAREICADLAKANPGGCVLAK